jgi:hypothetical protein
LTHWISLFVVKQNFVLEDEKNITEQGKEKKA